MPSWLILFVFSIGAVAFFVIGLSITIMIKGHFVDSEISTNKDMQRLGIKCAVQESREDEQHVDCGSLGCSYNCAACETEIH